MGVWKYTAKEQAAITKAYDVCHHMAGLRGKDRWLAQAVKYERKQRSCLASARWLVAEAFAKGLCSNPRASEIVWMSDGCQSAVLVGAACRVSCLATDKEMARLHERIDAVFIEARAAQDAYMARGLDRAAQPVGPAPWQQRSASALKAWKTRRRSAAAVKAHQTRRGEAYRKAIGASIELHRAEKGVQE